MFSTSNECDTIYFLLSTIALIQQLNWLLKNLMSSTYVLKFLLPTILFNKRSVATTLEAIFLLFPTAPEK